jgi:tetratricopeptide (TPR) repeat protein
VAGAAKPAEAAPKKQKDRPRRKPKAETCVAYGDFRLKEALAPGKSEAEQRQMLDSARRAYQQALEIDPRCLAAHRGLAQVALAEGNPRRAIGAYQALLKVSPDEAALWYELGMVHGRVKEWQPATAALGKACELDPANHQYAHTLGYCLARTGSYEQSLECFRRVDGEARAHYNLARMLLHVQQNDLARQHLTLALQKEPGLKEARELLARVDAGPESAGPVVPVQYEQAQR